MQSITDIISQYQLTVADWVFIFLAALTLGFGKAGIKGLGVIIVTIMALVFGSKASTGVLIPLMILADIFAVIYYHRHTQWKYLGKLLPTMIVGVLLGVWFGNKISENLFRQIMAVLILISVAIMIWMERKKTTGIPKHYLFSGGTGLLAGFTSMIGNLAGAMANIYFLAVRLPKNEFIGTAAWLFFIINVFKLPFHIFVWKTVTKESLVINALLIPGILIGFFLGVALVKRINNTLYRRFVFVATGIGALLILFR